MIERERERERRRERVCARFGRALALLLKIDVFL
jgi:hypothetical protein